jgi:nitrogen regulatory protein P-II 1
MNFRKVTAIFSSLDLDKVENALIGIGVPGMTVSKTHGFGEYRNYYTRDTMTDCVRVEIFTPADQADEVVRAIARTVHKGLESEGIIAVLPVEELVHIHDFKES